VANSEAFVLHFSVIVSIHLLRLLLVLALVILLTKNKSPYFLRVQIDVAVLGGHILSLSIQVPTCVVSGFK